MSTEELRAELVAHLKQLEITDIHALWGNAKEWARKKTYEMGGSYASFGTYISVRVSFNEVSAVRLPERAQKQKQRQEIHSFIISLEEVAPAKNQK